MTLNLDNRLRLDCRKRLAIAITLLVLLFTWAGCGGETALDTAVRLVRAMQMDRMMLLSMQLPVRRGQLRDEANAQQKQKDAPFYECVYAIDSKIFTDIYANVLAKEMSLEEMRSAIRFLEGDVGKKYVQNGIVQITELFGLPELSTSPKMELTKEELAAVEQFSNTAAGKKFSQQKILEQEAVTFAAVAKWKEAVAECARSTQQKK
jgi:hypothetical protein